MFIRQVFEKKTGYTRVQICENEKISGKVKQKIIKHVGVARNPNELERYCRLAAALLEQELASKNNYTPLLDAGDLLEEHYQIKEERVHVNAGSIQEEKRLTEGPEEIIGDLFDQTFAEVLPGCKGKILRDLVIERISEPDSKKGTAENLERKTEKIIDVSRIYRAMDALDKSNANVLKAAFSSAEALYPNGIDLVCFDVTTLYFESVQADELRDFGFSKDQQFHSVQVTLALATTDDGVPVGYKLFSGKTAEISTLISAIQDWKKTLPIKDALFVADRGMYSFGNLQAVSDAGYKFLVACPLKKLAKPIQDEILSESGYSIHQLCDNGEIYWLKDSPLNISQRYGSKLEGFTTKAISGRLITSFSSSRASKDRFDRERILKKVTGMLKSKDDSKDLISNSGYKKYVKHKGESHASVDEKKVQNEAAWDGMHGLFTNADIDTKRALVKYKNLLMIEDSFRISKSELKMRPVFHYTPKRIRAHIAICFIALCVARYLQVRLERGGNPMSVSRIREALNSVQASVMNDGAGTRFRVPSKPSDDAKIIYKTLGKERKLRTTRLKS